MFRKVIFWSHLSLGLAAAIGILVMSVTGVLLAYEHQLEHWADKETYAGKIDASGAPLPVDQLLETARNSVDWSPLGLTIFNDAEAAAYLGGSPREGLQTYIDPYTGQDLGPGNRSVQSFFGVTTRWHRWFDVDGDARVFAGAVIDISNVIFLLLIATGIYLWLPPMLRWSLIKARLWFKAANSSKARDFNWHHVFSVWALIPLFVIVFSGARISYQWPDDLVSFLFPQQAPPVASVEQPQLLPAAAQLAAQNDTQHSPEVYSLAALVADAQQRYPDWKSIELAIPRANSDEVSLSVALGEGRQPHKEIILQYHRRSGSLDQISTYGDRSAADRVLGLMLPLHTGEALGLIGQTLALLASVASILLVYTGLALSYRRLIQPLLVRK